VHIRDLALPGWLLTRVVAHRGWWSSICWCRF